MIFRNQLAVGVEIDQLRLPFELCMSAPPGLAWQMRFQPARAQALRGEATTRSLRMPEVTGNKVLGAISPGIEFSFYRFCGNRSNSPNSSRGRSPPAWPRLYLSFFGGIQNSFSNMR
jgi:hypothetical protein